MELQIPQSWHIKRPVVCYVASVSGYSTLTSEGTEYNGLTLGMYKNLFDERKAPGQLYRLALSK